MGGVRVRLATAGSALALVVLGATAGGAAPSSPAGPDVRAVALQGFQQVSQGFTDTALSDQSGVASCPAGTVVVGGGVQIASSGVSENVQGSLPYKDKKQTGWEAFVANSSTTAGPFTVYAECAKKPAKWKLVDGKVTSLPPGQQLTVGAGCPSGLVELGGGGYTQNGELTDQNLNSTSPYQNNQGWYANANNADPTTGTFAEAAAICAKAPAGYAQVNGNLAAVGADDQEGASVSCPSGTTVLSGGAVSSSSAVTVDVNSTFPETTSIWQVYEDDTAQDTSGVSADAICAET